MKDKIIIVIHNGFSFEQYIKIPMLFDFTKKLFRECIEKYKNVEYAFENVLPFVFDDEKFPRTRNGFLYDNIDLTNYYKLEHGTVFSKNEKDSKFLEEFFDLYYKYGNDAYITIEVFEFDYLDAKNYLNTKNIIQKYIREC